MLWAGAVVLVAVAACGDSSSTDDSKVAPTTPAATKPAPTPTPKPPPPTSTPPPPEPAPTATQPAPSATSAPEPDEPEAAAPEVGDPAPDFELAAASGSDMSLASYRGEKNVVVVFYRAFW